MKSACLFAALLLAMPALAQSPAKPQPHNVIIFVADGLRYGSVTPENMPNMFRLKSEGVDFTNSHSLFPTVTTVNASAIATGHYIGDTGDFGNAIYTGTPMISMNGVPLAALENDMVLAEMNQHFGGNYLGEDTLIARARAQGFSTAVIGKLGPARIQDSTAAPDGNETLLLDDNTGHDGGFGLPAWFTRDMKPNFVDAAAPRTSLPDLEQEIWLMKATTRIVLPHFAEAGKPFAMLFWSRDPDITQHNATDSVGEFDPGINGPSGLAAARNADTQLGALMAALKEQGLDKTTDVFVTADHGFITVNHASASSPSAHFDPVLPLVDLSFGFVAVDLASKLNLRLFDPGHALMPVDFGGGGKISSGSPLSTGTGFLGDPQNPDVVVVPNGGADLIYLPKVDGKGANAKELAGEIVKFLTTQDYVSGIFVNDRLGKFAGALPMSDVNLMGSARTPQPAIIVNLRSDARTCADKLQCTVGINDTILKTGQGSHGSLSRAETRNFMAAIGPDFKTGFADPAPISNADIAPTLAKIAGVELAPKGKLRGRVVSEALVGGAPVTVRKETLQSNPEGDVRTILNREQVGDAVYFDAAGFAGKTVGLTLP
jgi:arylsulfatase A-like enzyme